MLLQKSWHVFPCNNKIPVIKNWPELATNDPKKIAAWKSSFPSCNWALHPKRSNLLVIDVDRLGFKTWKKLCQTHGYPKTLLQRSASRGGLHYVFKAPIGALRLRGKLSPGIDVQSNNYILIAPSRGARGVYKWVRRVKPIHVPSWLLELIVKPKVKTDVALVSENCEYDILWLKFMAEQFVSASLDYHDWLILGFAFYSATNGSEEGLECFLSATENKSFVEGDLELARDKWDGFRIETDGVTTASIYYLAAKYKLRVEDLKPTDFFFDESSTNGGVLAPNWFNYRGRKCLKDPESLVDFINSLGFAIMKSGKLIRITRDQHGVESFETVSRSDFSVFVACYGHVVVKKTVDLDSGQSTVRVARVNPADVVWLESSRRAQYDSVIFRPKNERGTYNLWTQPIIPCDSLYHGGDVAKVLNIIEQSICSGVQEKREYLIKWLTHIVKRPQDKSSIVPVLSGPEGTGKGFLCSLMADILQSRYLQIQSRRVLGSNFNSDQAYKFLINLDEASFGGDHDMQALLRNRSGEGKLRIEFKFGGSYVVDDFARFIVTTNKFNAVETQASNRRYLHFEHSARYAEHKIFIYLWDKLRAGTLGPEFYGYLKGIDISDFLPNKFPKDLDQGAMHSKVDGDIYRSFIIDFTEAGIPIYIKDIGISKVAIYSAFSNYQKDWRRGKWHGQKTFWRHMREICPVLQAEKRVRFNGHFIRIVPATPQEVLDSCYETLRLGASEKLHEENFYFE